MDQQFDATYENGMLRPSVPLNLPEGAQVRVVIDHPTAAAAANGGTPSPLPSPTHNDDEIAAKQRAALQELFDKVDQLPQNTINDGWSAANNVDDVLYGGPDGPA